MIAVRQFAIVDHEAIDRGPNAGVFHNRGTGDDRTELFILAEGTTPAGQEFAGHVVTAIGQIWRTLDLSLTGSLRAVFAEAARNVRDWNEKSLAKQGVALGLTCVARRGDQVIIGMAGPGIAYHVGPSGLQAFLPHEEAAAPFDGAGELEATMERVHLNSGDNLLLLSAAAAQSLEPRTLAGVLQQEPEDILRDLYMRVRDLGQVTAVLLTPDATPTESVIAANNAVEMGSGGPVIGAVLAGATAAHEASAQPSLFVDGGAQEDALERALQRLTAPHLELYVTEPPIQEAVELAPLQRVSGDETLSRLANDHRTRADVTSSNDQSGDRRRPEPNQTSTTRWRQPNQPPPAAVPASRDHRNRSFSRTLRSGAASESPAAASNARPVSEMASERRADADAYRHAETLHAGPLTVGGLVTNGQEPLVRMRDDMGGRWKSGGNIGSGGGISMPPTWFVAFGGIAIFLLLIGFLVVPGLLKEESEQQQAALVDQAQQQLQVALVQQNATEKRTALNQAHATALEALAYDADNSMASSIVSEVAGAIGRLDAIASPTSVENIGSLGQFGDGPVAVARLVVGETEAYVLDSDSGAVIAMDLETGEPELIYAATEEVARPVALAFAEIAELGGPVLLIMDSTGALWHHTPGGKFLTVPISPPETFVPTDIAVFDQQLYVLDASNGTVWRFAPGGGGFDTLPAVALEAEELQTARRLMVDLDIITTNDGGDVRRYSGVLPLLMSQDGIDSRLVEAESPQPFGAAGQLAVLDPANDRIVVLERNGSFEQQYRDGGFQGITAFAMRAGVGYIYAGGWLRRVDF